MKHSPCCGRVAAYGDMKESLRLEVLENDRLRARVEELGRFVGDSEIRSDYQNAAQMRAAITRLTAERDAARADAAQWKEEARCARAILAEDGMRLDDVILENRFMYRGARAANVARVTAAASALTRHAEKGGDANG